MKFNIFLIILILPTILEAKCNSNVVGVYRSSGFGISFGGGESSAGSFDKDVTNVPLTINGQQACFKKKNSYKIDSKEKNKMLISPMDVEFENVPDPHFKQYIYIQKMPDSFQTKIITMSFVCSGETPLSTEAMSNSLLNLQIASELEVNSSSSFAMGVAAQNLKGSILSGKPNEALEFFSKLYSEAENKSSNEESKVLENPDCTELSIPSFISSSTAETIGDLENGISSTFSTLPQKTVNGCSEDFSKKMKNYLLENYADNESLKDFKVSKKWYSKNLQIEW